MSFQFLHEMLFTVETAFICTPYSHTHVRHSLSFQSDQPLLNFYGLLVNLFLLAHPYHEIHHL